MDLHKYWEGSWGIRGLQSVMLLTYSYCVLIRPGFFSHTPPIVVEFSASPLSVLQQTLCHTPVCATELATVLYQRSSFWNRRSFKDFKKVYKKV